MRTAAHVLGAAAVARLAVAAPAPQAFEFAEIMTAAPVAFSGPPLEALTQAPSEVVSTDAVLASITAEVTTVATAAITGAAASNAANISPPTVNHKKRDLEKRDLLSNIMQLLGARFNQGSSGSGSSGSGSTGSGSTGSGSSGSGSSGSGSSGSGSGSGSGASSGSGTTTTPSIKIQAPAPSTTTSSTTTSSTTTSSSAAATTSATSSSNTSGSGTSTSSSSTACPTTPEDGTYCGFINPEDPCAPQPDGYGPNVTSPDTPDAFMNYAPFQKMALSAVSPSGYVQTFSNLNASSSANSYMGLYTINKYDPSICAKWCDQTTGCTAFNLFIERDPSLNPCRNDSTDPTVWGYWCPNPPSITNYKCTLWGSNLDASTVVNQGGWRRDFNVVIVGSNGYDKTNITTPVLALPSDSGSSDASSVAASTATSASSVATSAPTSAATSAAAATTSSTTKAASSTTSAAGSATTTPAVGGKPVVVTPDPDWGQPKNCSGKAINAGNYWLGSKFINGPFDPSLCAAYAKATTQQNKQAAMDSGRSRYTPCQMFNAYHIYRNGAPAGTYCALYNAQLSTSWATTTGQYSGRDYYSCRNSWTWSLSTPDNGRC